jgi:2-hydroxychromene-2-carboxylate isomerase
MGNVIYLADRRAHRAAAPPPQRPTFFFDISSPLSYLTAERIERRRGEVDWVAVDGGRLRRLAGRPSRGAESLSDLRPGGERAEGQGLRARAEACARALRLPLVWPDRFPGSAPCALRACAFACELGAGGPFALAASRLAFCGGFDLEDPETLAEAAAAAGIPLDECLAAAGETWRDEELEDVARELAAHGVGELPVIRVGERWLAGESGLLAAEALLNEPGLRRSSLAPRA